MSGASIARNAGWIGAWCVFAAVYATLIYVQSYGAMPPAMSLRVALLTTIAPAAMARGVWELGERYAVRVRGRSAAFAVHVAQALLFAIAWAAWLLVVARLGSGPRMPHATLTHLVLPWQLVTGLLLYAAVAASAYAVRSRARARSMQLAAERAERLRAESQLAALRAHIDPHFFFNTLHSVSELFTTDRESARCAIERLAELFRYTLHLDRQHLDLVALEQEWRVIESYLWLEGLRLGERLRVVTSFDDDALLCAIPPFTLQPIVENAVRHGISPSLSGGTISVVARDVLGEIEITVSDDGAGYVPAAVDGANGLGLRSVRQRLDAQFGGAARFSVDRRVPAGTIVTMRFPAIATLAATTSGHDAGYSSRSR